MLRITIKETGGLMPNGEPYHQYKSFDVELPEIEDYLTEQHPYREVVAVEVRGKER